MWNSGNQENKMAENSKIEWCDHTFNPWEGCTKVSPGCANCYAEARNARFSGGMATLWGKGKPRRRTSAANWRQPLKWNRAEEGVMVSHAEFVANRRPRVFCASLADWLDDEVPVEWLADLLDLIRRTPNLDWLLLTKRPENWDRRVYEVRIAAMKGDTARDDAIYAFTDSWMIGSAPGNVWIGTSVEDQQRADERIPHLLRIPARVRFLSCEPLLGPVKLTTIIKDGIGRDALRVNDASMGEPERHVDWVICGGESGPGARPMRPDWARSLRDQCAAAGVAFFFKQWGEWAWAYSNDGRPSMSRVGKKLAGRVLDGLTWQQFPALDHPALAGREQINSRMQFAP